MKKVIVIALCLCLLFCGCAPSFSEADGSVLDKEFIETFPFTSSSLGTVADWFNEHDDYKIKKSGFDDIYVNYNGNVDWYIAAATGSYTVDGFYVLFNLVEEYSEQDLNRIFNCVVAELTDLCGRPVDTWNEGNCMTFYYGSLEINVRFSSGLTLDMFYNA